MRRVALVAVVLSAVAFSARADDTTVRHNHDSDGVDYEGHTGGHTGSHGGGGGGGTSGGYYEEHPYLAPGPDGQNCVATEYRRYDTPEEAQHARQADEERWSRLTRDFEMCPSAPAPGGSAAADAQAFWGTVPLPRPGPHIAPGWAVTGRKSYLETGSAPTARFTRDTPRGQLVIDATGPYYVDWGDGTTGGPYNEAGAAWPNGTITHVYERVGTYDVVVTQRWSADWHLDGDSGRLGGLRTEGRIDDFPARELQAVRNR